MKRYSDESGHLMAGLIAAIAIMLIFSTVAFQAWEDVIRRDKEAEMMFRAKEITRGILRYRKDHQGAGPNTLEQLAEPGPVGQYYLRRLYDDPLVEDGKWGLLYVGPGGEIFDPSAQAAQGQQVPGMVVPIGQLAQAPNPGRDLARASAIDSGGVGLPLAGVKSLCTETPFRFYNGVSDYSQWLFTYIDLQTGLKKAAVPGGNPNVPPVRTGPGNPVLRNP